ncbi:MAG: metal ABC transporter permease [Planctomycetota bacterium]|jgi:manganese/zinc/iron transport system permease protein
MSFLADPDTLAIMLIGVLAAISCSLLGAFLVLRRLSMMGDAISHAVLPGLAVAFLLTVWIQGAVRDGGVDLPAWLDSIVMVNARSGPIMFAGAAVVGLLTALFTQLLHQYGKVEQSASMGVVFTSLFALGLILMVRAAHSVDLDPGCVLYGAIEWAPAHEVTVLGITAPRSTLVLGAITLVNAAFVVVFYKELKITSFDPTLATTLGIKANVMHYLLMTLVAVTTVAAFEAVGSILVVAMLIVPGATAHLLTDRLPSMLAVSALVGAAGAVLGTIMTAPGWAGQVDTSTAGMMACATGVLFVGALLFAPRHGVLGRFARRTSLSLRIIGEDALGLLYRLEEHDMHMPADRLARRLREALGIRRLTARLALAELARRGLVQRAAGEYRMSDRGRTAALGLVRSHRLWEAYLVKHLALPSDHVHDTAMKLEHVTDPSMREDLAQQVDDPRTDPHGKAIPESEN